LLPELNYFWLWGSTVPAESPNFEKKNNSPVIKGNECAFYDQAMKFGTNQFQGVAKMGRLVHLFFLWG